MSYNRKCSSLLDRIVSILEMLMHPEITQQFVQLKAESLSDSSHNMVK